MMTPDTNLQVLTAARDAWLAASSFRQRRDRYKRYTYGDQWSDPAVDHRGHPVAEAELLSRDGRKPLTNNLIRQIVKIVIGRYRTASRDDGRYSDDSRAFVSDNQLLELDCRMLEEFLIAGCAVQRVSRETRRGRNRLWIDNVDPRAFFVNAYRDPRGNDIELIGMLHDLPFPEIVSRFGRGSRQRAAALARSYAVTSADLAFASPRMLGEPDGDTSDFFNAPAGRCRAIEVWTLDCRNTIVCHDRRDARAFKVGNSAAARASIRDTNDRRRLKGELAVDSRQSLDFVWHCRWFAPDGSLLASYDSPFAHGSHPFAVKLYPLTDGEIHSFVEDVIDQQRSINRMIVMIDHIIGSSAKGVLLFPVEQKLPDYSWEDISDAWARSNSIIPVTGRSANMPHQVVSSGADCGAYQLLALQMKLFDNISGIGDVVAGRNVSPSTGNAVYENQLRNSIIGLTDLLDSFAAFKRERDKKAEKL